MIKIRFVKGSDWISTGIEIGEADGDQPTHVEVILADGSLLGAHAKGGVQIRPAGYDAADLVHELIVPINLGYDMTGAQVMSHSQGWTDYEGNALEWLKAQVGKPYDFTGVIGKALGRDWREDDSWFCSELVARYLEELGFFEHLTTANHHVSPRDLLMILSSRLKLTWAPPAIASSARAAPAVTAA